MKTFIIGKKSNLSKELSKHIWNSTLVSLSSNKDIDMIINYKKKYNLVFNNFYPVNLVNKLNLENFDIFYKKSTLENLNLLKNINYKFLNKILYSSSSSVYGSLDKNNENKDKFNRKIYSSLKLFNEKLILNISEKKNLSCNILRIFNIYGGRNENFSLVSKISECIKKNKKITLFNNGNSIRDFIHVKDICKIYKKLLSNKKKINKVLDLGSGIGYKVIDLINNTGTNKKNIFFSKKNIDEVPISIADMQWLKIIDSNFKFISLVKYLRIKNKKKIKSFHLDNLKVNEKIKKNEGTIIYGCGNAGKQIFSALSDNQEKVLFFIDDNKNLHGNLYKNTKIISYKEFLKVNHQYDIKKIILSIPSLSLKKQNYILKELKEKNFDVRTVINKKFLKTDKISLNDIQYLNIEQIIKNKNLNYSRIKSLKNKNILVTGAAGSIGGEVCRQILAHKVCKKLVGLDNSELNIYNFKKNFNLLNVDIVLGNIRDIDFVQDLIKRNKINTIIHCAAYKHVNILEENPVEAYLNNTQATKKLCELAIKFKLDFLLVSTDKAVRPKSILGFSKRAAEKCVLNLARHSNPNMSKINIVRFGNVIGSSGSVIPKFIDQINASEPITVVDRKTSRYFMSINQACYLILKTFDLKLNNEIFVFDMGKSIKIYDIVKKLIDLKMKIDPNYKPKINYIGLQKGEKIKELLFYKSIVQKTKIQQIFKIKEKVEVNEDEEHFKKNIQHIDLAIKLKKHNEVLKYLKKIN